MEKKNNNIYYYYDYDHVTVFSIQYVVTVCTCMFNVYTELIIIIIIFYKIVKLPIILL